jgi:hypothetical protein
MRGDVPLTPRGEVVVDRDTFYRRLSEQVVTEVAPDESRTADDEVATGRGRP